MAKAKELIASKNYNDAILILTEVVREEPERQDEAQELISEIVRLRNQYNNDYEDLIKLLYQQKDVDAALQAIAKLEAIDKNPNKQTKDEISQAKRTARLIANNKRYRDIMARGLALLDQRQYAAAVQVYLEGSTLARDMFDEADYGNIVANQVDQAWADVKTAAALFAQAETRLKTLPAQGSAILAGGAGSLDPALAAVRDLAAWRRRAVTDGRLFRNQNEFLVKNGRQEDFFLGYSYLFIHGPADAKAPEGIQGAFDRLWSDILTPWTEQIRRSVDARYVSAKTLVDQGRLSEAGPAFEALRAAARQGLDVATLWNQLADIGPGTFDDEIRGALGKGLPLGLWMDHRLTLALQGLRATGTAASLTPPDDRPAIETARAEAKRLKAIYAGFSDLDGNWLSQSGALASMGYTLLDPPAFGTTWQTVWAGYRQRYLDSESGLVDRRGQLDYRLLDQRFQAMQTTLTDIREQVEGKIKFPLQATGRLGDLRPVQDSLAGDVNTFVSLYDGETDDVKTAAVQRWPVRGRELLGRLNAAQTLRGQLQAAAQASYQQSLAAKKQGQDLVPRIASLINAENFDQARSVLNEISTRYSQSLALQEDPGFRTESDAQIKSLFDAILKAENIVVVRDVRALITKGSQSYLDQQFNAALQTLTTARARWATTNGEERNPEVEYWLNLAVYATSVTTGRELSPIDPLYNEVQQLLNFARRNFNLAQEKFTAGQKAEGTELMRQAKETITKILIPFPLNQEARLLNLGILKASDPENFPTLFAQTLRTAVAKIKTDPTAAYSDLQDLDKIQPHTPEIEAAIKDVRIAIGLDPKPIDPQAIARSRTLTAQAQRILDGGVASQLPNAATLARQAVTLDPNNRTAGELFDRISLVLRSTVQTLNVTQRGEITIIGETFRESRTNEALQQITLFEQKYPGIINIPEVKELDRRIRAVSEQ